MYYRKILDEQGDPVIVSNKVNGDWETIFALESCKMCHGSGFIGRFEGCPHCLGSGEQGIGGTSTCVMCDGTGRPSNEDEKYRQPCPCLKLKSEIEK